MYTVIWRSVSKPFVICCSGEGTVWILAYPFALSYFPVPPTTAIWDSFVAVLCTPKKLTPSSSSSPSPPNTTVNAMVRLLPSNELVKWNPCALPITSDPNSCPYVISSSITVILPNKNLSSDAPSGFLSITTLFLSMFFMSMVVLECVGLVTVFVSTNGMAPLKGKILLLGFEKGSLAVWVSTMVPTTILSEGADPPTMSCIKKVIVGAGACTSVTTLVCHVLFHCSV